jgi:hypothetical protein
VAAVEDLGGEVVPVKGASSCRWDHLC